MTRSDATLWLARSRTLATALLWRVRRERLRSLATVFLPFVLTLASAVALPLASDDSGTNGADSSAALGLQYGASGDAIAAGLLLTLIPGVVAVHGTLGAGLAVRNVIGAEAGVGALEAMLAAPYSAASIAGGLLGYALVVTASQWAVMTVLGALALAVSDWLHHDSLSPDGGYLALALGLPLLAAWAGAALALMLSLLFPRLAQPAQAGLAGNGSALVSLVAMAPGFGALLALALGLTELGPIRLLTIAGGVTVLITVCALVCIARGFRPESVLGSS
ncbi:MULTISPECIES: hypothetical protein [Streptomyces]|uniref:hypothetical protein n=1 Tax=Streptomyces TaxID=1883 RepID=UPI00017EA38C|nr:MULTISPECIES: hypothetical protein [Streptomyces]EDX22751.1 hypothetical protein SSAG_02542 [Streptomyces sp. Mg1]RPK52608.1 hypothetical protein EES37_02855 [Streptomyces sp. ADI91-18]WSR98856.1 hypothetical protein OG224_12700 [Streptomyces goshikiensis]